MRFAVRYVQQARIASELAQIAYQVVCCTSFWNGRREGYVSGRRRINRAVNPAWFHVVLVAAADVLVLWQQFVRHCTLVSLKHARSPPQEVFLS